MNPLRYTLLADGGADRRLLPVISWTFSQHTTRPIVAAWADLYFARPQPHTLAERVTQTINLFPADVIVVHRDAEAVDPAERLAEIQEAVVHATLPTVALIPVRMQEAWFLFAEATIRQAANNPRGTVALALPLLAHTEQVADPKERLFDALRTASEHTGRRLRRFNVERAAHRVAELIADYSPLRILPAFQAFEGRVQEYLRGLHE
jgi:hypothetical protein